MTQAEAAREVGVSLNTARGIEYRATKVAGQAVSLREDVPEPLPYSKLSESAKRAYKDIGYFARRYYGLILMPFHLEDTARIQELAATREKEFVCINIMPGTGKTEFYTRVLPAWLTVRDRTIRGMLGSASHTLASRFTRSLRTDFTRRTPIERPDDAKKEGWAVDAISTLAADYGHFRPETGDDDSVWRQDRFVVAQLRNQSIAEKEHTWAAFGRDSEEIGTRVNIAVWDDLYSEKRIRTPETKSELYRWWTSVAERRLEPGGLLLLVGQRLGPDDIYHYVLGQTRSDDEGNPVPKYHHIIHKGHYEDRCKGAENHHLDAPPWPIGCLLYPKRVSFREISDIQRNTPDIYEYVIQQSDYAPTDVLVHRIWVEGGVDENTGEEFPGCWDENRDICEFPRGLTPPLYSFATADPSPTKYWSVQWWLYHPGTEQRFLLDLIRARMDAPDLLDWDYSASAFTGLMDDWQRRSVLLAVPITHWIIEVNAAQKFLLQYDHVRRWKMANSVTIVPHTTGVNKSDSDLGVPAVAPHWKYGRIRLPGKSHQSRARVQPLVDEACRYNPATQKQSGTDDCVMAHWFNEWNIPRLTVRGPKIIQQARPSWALAYARS